MSNYHTIHIYTLITVCVWALYIHFILHHTARTCIQFKTKCILHIYCSVSIILRSGRPGHHFIEGITVEINKIGYYENTLLLEIRTKNKTKKIKILNICLPKQNQNNYKLRVATKPKYFIENHFHIPYESGERVLYTDVCVYRPRQTDFKKLVLIYSGVCIKGAATGCIRPFCCYRAGLVFFHPISDTCTTQRRLLMSWTIRFSLVRRKTLLWHTQ